MINFDWYRLFPKYWIQNRDTCYEWDRVLNNLLDNYPIEVGLYMVTFGKVKVWVGNYPYAYGYLNLVDGAPMPKVSTRNRLRRMIMQHYINQSEATNETDH